MQNEIKTELEKSAREDLNYILNYKPIAKDAKSAQHFSKMTIIKPRTVARAREGSDRHFRPHR